VFTIFQQEWNCNWVCVQISTTAHKQETIYKLMELQNNTRMLTVAAVVVRSTKHAATDVTQATIDKSNECSDSSHYKQAFCSAKIPSGSAKAVCRGWDGCASNRGHIITSDNDTHLHPCAYAYSLTFA
jgi:hypothetical protein